MKKISYLIIFIGLVLISISFFFFNNENKKTNNNETNNNEIKNNTDNTDYEELELYKTATLKSSYVNTTTFDFPEELQCSILRDSEFYCNNSYKYNNASDKKTRIIIEGKIARYSNSLDEVFESSKETASYHPGRTISDYGNCKDNMRCYRTDYIEQDMIQDSNAYLLISFPDNYYIDASISIYSTEYPNTKQMIDEYLDSFIKSIKIEN